MSTTPRPRPYRSLYGYVPTEWVCALFIGLFGLSTLLHVGQSIRHRMWWLFPTAVLAGTAEIIGWIGRFLSSRNPYQLNPYLMQICTTIIAPTPLVAANFIILGKIIEQLGRQYSRLSPKWYTIIFCSFDLVALIVQAIGGASAATAAQTMGNPEKGGNIMLGGIAFQMVAITLYVALATEFLWRYFTDRPVRSVTPAQHDGVNDRVPIAEKTHTHTSRTLSPQLKQMIFALVFSTLCIFIRSVYRTIELADGWTGRIITTQLYFNVLDGAMIVLAMYTLNIFHPGRLLNKRTSAINQ